MAKNKSKKSKTQSRLRRQTWSVGHWLALAGLFFLAALVSFNVFGFAVYVTNGMTHILRPSLTIGSKTTTRSVVLEHKTLEVSASAYSSSAFQTDGSPCITANGYDVCKHYFDEQTIDTVAINGLPFGTFVRFPALFPHLTFVVRDRMNPRYAGHNVDIWMPTRGDAVAFGRRTLDMEVYEPVE